MDIKVTEFDLVKSDKKTIDTQKVLLKIWEYRKDTPIVTELANILSKFIDEKRVFADIEYFLPQIAHLTIHLERNEALEYLIVLIAQTSIHAALQLSFIFSAALEDYQPEIGGTNKVNPFNNPHLFHRCARLLEDVERAVIYGSFTVTANERIVLEKKQSEKGIDSNTALTTSTASATPTHSSMKDLKKEEMASTLARMKSFVDGQLCGDLMYKRVERKSAFHSKAWKKRYFIVDKRVLLCFKDPYAVNPLRAVHLQNAQVMACETHPKYGDTLFEVTNEVSNTKFYLRAENAEKRKSWINVIRSQINGAPPVLVANQLKDDDHQNQSERSAQEKDIIPAISLSDMTPIQRKRFSFFRQLRIFITNMTNICERLRFKERNLRKFFLKHDMKELVLPPFVYIPLCSSLDPYRTIVRTNPKECHVFNTKARCPALMIFECEQHPQSTMDVATFLGIELERYSESEIIPEKCEIIQSFTGTATVNEDNDGGGDVDPTNLERKTSKFSGFTSSTSYWASEGTGLQRLEEANIHLNLTIGKPMPSSDSVPPPSIAGGGIPAATTSSASLVPGTPASMKQDAEEGETKADSTGTASAVVAASPLGEKFEEKGLRLQQVSPYGHLPGWKLGGLIAKSNDDVRQEVFVMQMIQFYQKIFKEANIPVWLHCYRILSTSKTTGLIELIPNSSSFDALKKKPDYPGSLRLWYEQSFGKDNVADPTRWNNAMEAYISSMAGYSVVAFLLAIKDRHNGNIMVDQEGHIIHIDFGFVFGLAPGKAASLEKAPWKLNKEMVDVMGGLDSEYYLLYKQRCIQAFTAARKRASAAIALMEMTQLHSNFPAFRYNPYAVRDFRSRYYLDIPDSDIPKTIEALLRKSYCNVGSDFYDSFQLATNGIAK